MASDFELVLPLLRLIPQRRMNAHFFRNVFQLNQFRRQPSLWGAQFFPPSDFSVCLEVRPFLTILKLQGLESIEARFIDNRFVGGDNLENEP